MAERFLWFDAHEIQELKETSENQNTNKSAKTWPTVWTTWTKIKQFESNFLSYDAKRLNETSSIFFAEIRKKDGSEYEPDSQRVMFTLLDRHLKENESTFAVAKDEEFLNSRKVLEGKACIVREQGYRQ